jgi:protein phosphatase
VNNVLAFVKTDIGLVREVNEDQYVFQPPHLFVVADGMGGHVAGEIASTLAVNTIVEYVHDQFDEEHIQTMLESAVHLANQHIYERSQQGRQYLGMGTTVTACYVVDTTIYWAHVGDSRMYILHDNKLRQITDDHSLVGELLRNGTITKEEAAVHPQRNILTRAVGTSSKILVDSGTFNWEITDVLLLCTDGLSGLVEEAQLSTLLEQSRLDGQAAIDSLIQRALDAGGYDNITTILVHYSGEN